MRPQIHLLHPSNLPKRAPQYPNPFQEELGEFSTPPETRKLSIVSLVHSTACFPTHPFSLLHFRGAEMDNILQNLKLLEPHAVYLKNVTPWFPEASVL